MAPSWNFIPTPKGGVQQSNAADNFFREDSANMVENLVRENIQNALDAQSGKRPVLVRFSLTSSPRDKTDFLKELLATGKGSVLSHYRQACEESDIEPENPDFKAATFLLIEDFHTDGLDGDTASSSTEDGGFATFWRNVGSTNKGKGNNRGGAFGIGKIVNPMASRLQTFFGLTIRNTSKTKDKEAGPYLMGQTMLSLHTYAGVRYQAYALWGEVKRQIEYPIESGHLMKDFIRATGITRKDEPGLSIVIPFPINEFTPRSLSDAAILHYFYPIIEGRLIIEIANGKGEPDRIDDSNIEDLAKGINPEIAELIAFTKKAQKAAKRPYDIKPTNYRLDNYGESLGAQKFDAGELKTQKDRFLAGDMITVDVPIETQFKKTGEVSCSSVKLFLQKTDGKGMDYYIRQGISVYENSRFMPSTPCIALLLADEGEIAELLRKAEGPAHSTWMQKKCRAVKIYENAQDAIGYVKSLLSTMQSLLGSGIEIDDESILADDFPDDIGDEEEEDIEDDVDVDIDGNPAMLDLSRDSRGNLTIKANEHADAHAGKDCALTLYFVSTSRGAKWRPFDFNLRNMTVDARGTTILSRDKNVMKFILNPKTEITIDGFDRNKDLKAKVKLPKARKAKA